MNGKISTSKNSSISTFTSPSVVLTNDKGCLLLSSIHYNIKYSYFSGTQSRAVMRASDVMNTQIKFISHKICHYFILEYLFKDKNVIFLIKNRYNFYFAHTGNNNS